MYQYIIFSQFLLNQLIKLREVFGDVFRFHVEQRVDYVVDCLVVFEVVHANCGGDD